MMSSYLVIAVHPELVPRDELADLLDLIWLRHSNLGLQVDDLVHAVAGEYVVTTTNPLIEAQTAKQPHQLGETDVGIRPAAQNRPQYAPDPTDSSAIPTVSATVRR